jgi:hypothetical protein
MPNIEIHGMGSACSDGIRSKICSAMNGANYVKEIVITTATDFTGDIEGNPRPFLRVVFAKNEPAGIYNDCLKRIDDLKMDTEVLVIERFIPANPSGE